MKKQQQVSLIDHTVLSTRLNIYFKTIKDLNESLTNIEVIDENTKNTCLNVSRISNDLLKTIDEDRKIFGKPFLDATKAINNYYKWVVQDLEDNLKLGKKKLNAYVQVENERIAKENEKNKLIIDESMDEFDTGITYLKNVFNQLQSRIFGGEITNSKNQLLIFPMPQKQTDIVTSFEWFKLNKDKIQFSKLLEPVKENFFNLINKMFSDAIITFGSNDFYKLQDKFTIEFNTILINEASKTIVSDVSLVPSNVGVSTRKTLKYKLVDKTLIPQRYLSLDDEAIKNFIKANSPEYFKDIISNDNQPISGLEFYYDENVVLR